jgi:large subunit ribosomal protein L29
MKVSEMRELTSEEIRAKIDTLHKELFEARFKKATHQLEDTAIFRRKRTLIAQLNTILREKELQSQGEKVHA